MQIGAGKLGMVEKTELFIPGRVLWGALTATFSQHVFSCPRDEHYQQIGKQLAPNIEVFGTFFPSFDQGKTWFYPVFNGFCYHWNNSANDQEVLRDDEIARRLLFCATSTALNPERMAAEDGLLHSTDMIAPLWRTEKDTIPVCFCGSMRLPVFVEVEGRKTELDSVLLKHLLKNSRLGGGRKRGWGRIAVKDIELAEQPDRSPAQWLTKNTQRILLTPQPVQKGDNLVAGRCVLAVFREYSARHGFGQGFSSPRLVWQVGSVLNTE